MRLRSLPEFEYMAPKDLNEACSLLQRHGARAKVMAGGTDLLMAMKQRILTPRYVIGLKHVPDLDRVSYKEGQELKLGPLVTHQSIVDNPVIRERFGALWTACSKVGTPNIRNMGTIGGNVCNAAPSADSAPPLIAYNAVVKVMGVAGERSLPLEAFFVGPGKTALQTGEMLVEIDVPCLVPHSGLVYVKLPARSAVDIAAVGVAACITLDAKNDTCRDVRIVLGAVAPTPIRVRRAEETMRGEKITDIVIQKAAQVASEESRPISDVRSSAKYRTEMVNVLMKQAIRQALAQAKSA
jgi:carbon-monoxide dehydrogenase medium subunit